MGQPPITYESLDAVGVRLVPSSAPEFAAALKAEGKRIPEAFLPYAVLIKNESNRNMMAWSVRWYFRFSDRQPVSSDLMSHNFLTLKPEDGILAGGVVVTTEIGPAEPLSYPVNTVVEGMAAERARLYSTAVSGTISIESVLFDDGETAGPDRDGWRPRLLARVDAERDLTDEVLTAPTPAAARKIIADVQEAAYRLLPPDWPRGSADLYRAASEAIGYDKAYTLLKAEVATRQLLDMSNLGDEEELRRLRQWRAGRKYPGEARR